MIADDVLCSGNNGIGLETTRYLAQKGATVYVASRNKEKSLKAIAEVEKKLSGKAGSIKFHQCDISSIGGAKESAEAFKKIEKRIDILVANAGISIMFRNELSPDGYEKTFATNHLGHMAFVMTLLRTSCQSLHRLLIRALMPTKLPLRHPPTAMARLALSL